MKKRPLKYFFALFFYVAVVTTAGISSAAQGDRSPESFIDGTMLAASVLSANLTDAYADYVIDPLGNILFNLLYSTEESQNNDIPLPPVYPPIEQAVTSPEPEIIAPETADEPAPVTRVAAPLSNLDIVKLVKKIVSDEVSYLSPGNTTGVPGPRGPQGPEGPRGPAGPSGNSADTSEFVSQTSFEKQVDAILTSIENSSESISDSIGDAISTGSLSSLSLSLRGSTSGTISITPAAAAGSYTLTLPTDDGTSGQMLTTDGTGVLSWSTVTSGANTALSNLASVAINTSLVSDTDNTDDLGTSAIGWRTGYFDTSTITPTIIGGSSTTQDLTFQTTSGIGASGADMHFLVGNNGTTEAMTILNSGNVGIGDTSPNSLFTVGSGDLFQINSTGQIGSQQAPQSDYLFALTGTAANDHSRIIDITQANDSNEDSAVINVVNTVNLGTINANRNIRNIYTSLTPTVALSSSGGDKTVNVYGADYALDLSNETIGPIISASAPTINNYGQNVVLSGSPIFNANANDIGQTLNLYGYNATITATPTLTSVSDAGSSLSSYGGYFDNQQASAGNANLVNAAYGIRATATGDLTTTGATSHFGGYFSASGTSDTNYGIYVATVSGATNNYSAIFEGGNVGIGDTTPDALLDVNLTTAATGSSTVSILDLVDSGGGTGAAETILNVTGTLSGTLTQDINTTDVAGINVNPSVSYTLANDGLLQFVQLYGVTSNPSFSGSLTDASDSLYLFGFYTAPSSNLGTTADTLKYGVFSSVSGTADTNYGISVSASGATNNYGLDVFVNSGANNYAVYSSGTAKSYLNGTLKIGGTALRATTEGTNHLDIFDGTVPAGTLANGVSLYSDTGELKVMDAAGNATLLSPHENENNYWVFDSANSETGKTLVIDMELIIKDLNDSLELDYVHETQDGELVDRNNYEGSLLSKLFEKIAAWLADAGNGIGDLFANTFRAKDQICINETCVTEAQLIELLDDSGMSSSSPASGSSEGGEEPLLEEISPAEEGLETPAETTTEESPALEDPVPAETEGTLSEEPAPEPETVEPSPETPAETEETVTKPEPPAEEPAPEPTPEPTPEPAPAQ